MAVLPSTRSILREDLRDAPDWIERLLTPMNTINSSFYNALNGTLTYVENIRAQIKEITFQTPSTYVSASDFNSITFPLTLKSRPVEVRVMQIIEKQDTYTPIKKAVWANWTLGNGEVIVDYISGLKDSTNYFVRIIVI